MSEEAAAQKEIIVWAKKFGWLHYHNPDSRRSTAGFPDLILLHQELGRLMVLEVKSTKGRLRPAQRVWRAAWTAFGVRYANPDGFLYAVVRPQDVPNVIDLLRAHKFTTNTTDGRQGAPDRAVWGDWPPISRKDLM